MKRVKKKRPITERFSLPAELMPGVPRTTMSGGSEVYVENYAGLKTYTRSCIEIKTRDGLLRIGGDELELTAMTKNEIIIRGLVVSVERL